MKERRSGTSSPLARPDHHRLHSITVDRADWPWLAALLATGCLALLAFEVNAEAFTRGRGGVPLDDAWIHFQFARNLARGDGFAFNAGQPTAGSTAPLWTLLLAGVYYLGGRFPFAGQLLSGASLLAALVATYALAKRLTGERWTAWLAGALVAVNGRTVWAGLSGLETCLFAALSVAAIRCHLADGTANRMRLRTAALFALAALARPEGYLLFALALADRLWSSRPRRTSGECRPWSLIGRLVPAAGTFTALVLPYALFSVSTSGHPLPNTFSAKATFDFRPDLGFLGLAARYLILDNPILLPFFVLGAAALLRGAWILTAWSIGLPIAYAFLHAALYQHGRYLIPLIPCNAVLGVAGLLKAVELAERRGWRWAGSQTAFAVMACLLGLSGTAWRLPTMARLYARNVDEINQMHLAMGNWVAQNTPTDTVLAVNDIGGIAYVSERRIVDLAGLVTPEVVPILRGHDTADDLVDFLAHRGVDYVIIFPDWFPQLAGRADVLEPVHEVTLGRRSIAGGARIVVYRTLW